MRKRNINNGQNNIFIKKCFMITWLGVICCCQLAAQTPWFVATTGVDNTDPGRGESWALPFATIAYAVGKASDDDVVQVSNGVYLLDARIEVNKGVTIRGVNTPGQTNTIVDGNNTVRGFYIRHPDAVVDGFMITNGAPTSLSSCGGGVYMTNGLLRNCVVAFNSAYRGGGIYQSTAGVISNCAIISNTADPASGIIGGGGVVLRDNGTLIDSIIEGNENIGSTGGGGVHVYGSGPQIMNCRVSYNKASGAGGGLLQGGSGMISNVNFIANRNSNMGAGVYIGSGDVQIFGGSMLFNTNKSAGGGLSVGANATATISHVSICSNSAMYGAGMYVYGQAVITNCNVIGNQCFGSSCGIVFSSTAVGAGISAVMCSRVIENMTDGDGKDCYGAGIRVGSVIPVLIQNCEIIGNSITNARIARGGGVFAYSNTVIRNCLIKGNWVEGSHGEGGQGGGVYFDLQSSVPNEIESCTIVSNYARLRAGGVYLRLNGADIVRNSIVGSNVVATGDDNWYFGDADRKTNVSYTCTPDADANWGAGCISADPLFADPVSGNYRLQTGSPCINTGTNQMDWMPGGMDLDGRERLDRFSRQVDMGCYEYLQKGAMIQIR